MKTYNLPDLILPDTSCSARVGNKSFSSNSQAILFAMIDWNGEHDAFVIEIHKEIVTVIAGRTYQICFNLTTFSEDNWRLKSFNVGTRQLAIEKFYLS